MTFTAKQKLGALGLDLPRFEWHLRRNWSLIRNRNELLRTEPSRPGAHCCWQWTSDLHLPKVFPSTGGRLLARCLADRPVRFADKAPMAEDDPQVSFIIGHRGTTRLPHLLATLRTIAAQHAVRCECIVVEQAHIGEIDDALPSWVRYVYTKPPTRDMPYCRAWTLNVGARAARGSLLVLHDNDMLVTADYAAELWRYFEQGYEVINLKRFIFYLEQVETAWFFANGKLRDQALSEAIVQNLEAGGSIAVGRDAFMSIGGFDESFIGWGGEDNEFWERAQTLKNWTYGYLPLIHLWHAAQPRKTDPANPALMRYLERSTIEPATRIRELRGRKFGEVDGLSTPHAGQ